MSRAERAVIDCSRRPSNGARKNPRLEAAGDARHIEDALVHATHRGFIESWVPFPNQSKPATTMSSMQSVTARTLRRAGLDWKCFGFNSEAYTGTTPSNSSRFARTTIERTYVVMVDGQEEILVFRAISSPNLSSNDGYAARPSCWCGARARTRARTRTRTGPNVEAKPARKRRSRQ